MARRNLRYNPKSNYSKTNTNMSHPIVQNTEKTIAKAVWAGGIGTGASYFLLKRNDAISLFGMNISEYIADGLLIAASSVTGDLLGAYALPYAEKMVVNSPKLESMTKYAIPPALAGLQHVVIKKYGTDSDQSIGSEIALSVGSKLVADGIVDAYMSKWVTYP